MLHRLTTRLYDNAYLLLSFMALCWAGNQVLGRAVAGHIPPITYSFLRWSLATVIVLPFALPHLRRDWPVIRTHWRYITFVGAIGGGLFNTLQYIGLNHTTALNSVVLNSTGPIFIAMASFLIFRERLTVWQAGGTAVSMAGVLGIISKGDLAVLHALAFNNGDLLLMLGMATNGIYTALLRGRPVIHWLSFLLTLFLVSALVVLPFLIWESASGARMEVTPFTLAAITYVAIFPSVVAYICAGANAFRDRRWHERRCGNIAAEHLPGWREHRAFVLAPCGELAATRHLGRRRAVRLAAAVGSGPAV